MSFLQQQKFSTLRPIIATHSFEILIHWLTNNFGRTLNTDHKEALRMMTEYFAKLITGEWKGRMAFPLPPAAGKTLAVVATITALYRLEESGVVPRDTFSTLVAAQRIESLCDMIRDLQALGGVPAEKIGLIHSKIYKPDRAYLAVEAIDNKWASLPATTDNENRPYMFVAHTRLFNPKKIPLLTTYKGQPKSILWWDESLITSSSWSILHGYVEDDVLSLPQRIEIENGDGTQGLRREALTFLQECVELLGKEKARAEREGLSSVVVDLPFRTPDQCEQYIDALSTIIVRPVSQSTIAFLEMASLPVRINISKSPSQRAYISFTVGVPKELDRIAILDASYPIRELERMDKSIHPAPHDVFSKQFVTYERYEAFLIAKGGGRTGIEKEVKNPHRDRPLVKEVVHIVKDLISVDEKVLIFSYGEKAGYGWRKAVDIERLILKALTDAGVNLDRVSFATWGNQTASNRYREIHNIILLGILQRSDHDVLASIAGQMGDLNVSVSGKKLEAVHISESGYNAHQALCRGAIRQDRPTRAWIVYHRPNELRRILRKVMPGIRIRPYEPKYLPSRQKKRDADTAKIRDFLNAAPLEAEEYSFKEIRQALQLRTPTRTYSRCLEEAMKGTPEWFIREGARSFKRKKGGDCMNQRSSGKHAKKQQDAFLPPRSPGKIINLPLTDELEDTEPEREGGEFICPTIIPSEAAP